MRPVDSPQPSVPVVPGKGDSPPCILLPEETPHRCRVGSRPLHDRLRPDPLRLLEGMETLRGPAVEDVAPVPTDVARRPTVERHPLQGVVVARLEERNHPDRLEPDGADEARRDLRLTVPVAEDGVENPGAIRCPGRVEQDVRNPCSPGLGEARYDDSHRIPVRTSSPGARRTGPRTSIPTACRTTGEESRMRTGPNADWSGNPGRRSGNPVEPPVWYPSMGGPRVGQKHVCFSLKQDRTGNGTVYS